MKTPTSKATKLHEVIILDNFPPEDIAMLQALYSRDPRTVRTHLERVREAGPGKFMEKFYVGYGHKSIGDCGSTTLFIEGVSMLGAKAIQDWPLYNGQESSTRYLDFSKMKIANPLGTKKAESIQLKWMKLYNEALDILIKDLSIKHPIKEGEKPEVYSKAIKARAFDISRCLLPAGMTTMVAWHTNLRQAADHLKNMRHHPLQEVKDVAVQMIDSLKEKYPNSFGHKQYFDEEKYLATSQAEVAYMKPFKVKGIEYKSFIRKDILKRYATILKNRPHKAELPYQIKSAGDMIVKYNIDFGSYRDIQRQRSVVMPQPLLTTKLGFNEWYLNNFPKAFRTKLVGEIKKIIKEINDLKCSDEDRQYYIGMGFQVSLEMTATIPSLVYVAELRSGNTVHASLRPIAQEFGKILKKEIPGIKIYTDESPDEFSAKRGVQDIVLKK
jgi:thymidylate synthase ThyX